MVFRRSLQTGRVDGDLQPVWTDQQKGGIAMFRRIDAASAST